MSRTVRTAREKAEAALGVSDRKIARADSKRADLKAQLKKLDAEIAAEEKQRAYLASNPALPQTPADAEPGGGRLEE